MCRTGGLERYGRSAHARGRDKPATRIEPARGRISSRRWQDRGRPSSPAPASPANAAPVGKSDTIPASVLSVRGGDSVTRNRALMKMSDANHLRDENQRRAENRDRARRPIYPCCYLDIIKRSGQGDPRRDASLIEPAAATADVSSDSRYSGAGVTPAQGSAKAQEGFRIQYYCITEIINYS